MKIRQIANHEQVKWVTRKNGSHPDEMYFVDTPDWFFDEDFLVDFPLWYVHISLHENRTKILVADMLKEESVANKLESREVFESYLKEANEFCNNHESAIHETRATIAFSFEQEILKVEKTTYVLLFDRHNAPWVFENGKRVFQRGIPYYEDYVKKRLDKIQNYQTCVPDIFGRENGYYLYSLGSEKDDVPTLKKKLYDKLNSEFEQLKSKYITDYSKKVITLLQEKLLNFYNSQNGNTD